MSELVVVEAPDEPPPTGPDDPFDPVEPGDPYLITEAPDPLAPTDPDPDPTTTGGVDIPPPPSLPPGRQPPPGHAALTTAVTTLGPLPDPDDRTAASRFKTWRMAQEGRFSLSDHWDMLTHLQFVTADGAAAKADDPTAEKAKLAQLRADLATGAGLSAALDAWCKARDATPVDLNALAQAAANVKAVADPLSQKLTVTALIDDPTQADYHRQLLGSALGGIVTEIASEGRQALAGERVPRGTSSDVATYHLEKMTRDRNWASRLEASSTWSDAARMVRTAITPKTLDTVVSKAKGKLNLDPMVKQLKSLDAALKARDKAGAKPDYATRSEVLRRYLAAANELASQIKTVRARQSELAGPKPSAGWDPIQTRNAGDVLAGLARSLQEEMAADPLLQDPDLAAAARDALNNHVAPLATQTSLEALVDKAGTDLRTIWSNAKQAELKALKAANVDLGDLPKLFSAGSKGLGPLLDKWTAAVAKFPRQQPSAVKNLAAQIAAQIQRYRTAINQQIGAERSSGLVEGLDVVAAALVRQIRSYDDRGGLFG